MGEILPTNSQPSPEAEPQGMRAIIVGPKDDGEGMYCLVAEDGELLRNHFCSDASFAEGDLFSNHPEYQEMFDQKGITSFVWLHASGLTREETVNKIDEAHV